jgi:hypothetical protein
MEEQWKPIIIDGVSYKNYEISTHGRVRTMNYKGTGEIKVLKLAKRKDNYFHVNLCKSGKYKSYLVHRLVATMFIPNPDNLTDVDHIDQNRENNYIENLRWLSHGNNIVHSQAKKVICIETGIVYKSTKDAQRKTGFNRAGITQCCNGKQETCGSYHWMYYTDYLIELNNNNERVII